MKALVVGVGRIGSSFDQIKEKNWINSHIGTYRKNSKIEKIAICDKDIRVLKKAANFWSIKESFDNLDEALKDFSPEIVSVCTGARHNLEIIRKITRYRSVKLLWIEKPFSDTLKNAFTQQKLLVKHNIHFVTNYQRRFDRFYLYVKDHVTDLVGSVQKCVAYFSGGVVNTASHLVNLLIFYFGVPETSVSINIKAGEDRDSHGDFCLDFKNFKAFCFELNKQSSVLSGGYSIFEIQIFGDKGRMDIRSLPFNEYDYDYYVVGKSRFKNVKVLDKKRLGLDFKRRYMENGLKFLLDKVKKRRIKDTEGAIETLKILKEIGVVQ